MNFTSFAFFTVSLYSAPKAPVAPVVLSEDTIHPIFAKSRTVAAEFNTLSGRALSPGLVPKFTKLGCSVTGVPGVVITGLASNADVTPVIFLLPKSTPSGLKVIVVPFPPILVMSVNTGFNE